MDQHQRDDSGFSRPADDREPDFARFCSIEEMQAASEAEGWEVDYRQIQAGQLLSSTSVAQCAGFGFMDEFVSRRIELTGSTPVDHITILVPVGPATLWVNGHTLNERGALFLSSGSDTHIVNQPNVRCLSTHVPIALLQQARLHISDTWAEVIDGKTAYIEPGVESLADFKGLMLTALYTHSTGHEEAELVSDLITNVDSIFRRAAPGPLRDDRKAAIRGRRIIERARDYIEAHIGDPIRMDDVCLRTSVSISTLERTFRRELGMSPGGYIRARRLAAINRELKRADGHHTQVGEVALKYGISHQGRFAGAYSTQFGELPSETLKTR